MTAKHKSNVHQDGFAADPYGTDMAELQSLPLIAAPDPKNDLSDEELARYCEDPTHSPELIRYLIEFVKKI